VRTVTLQSILLRAWQRVGNDASSISNIPSGAQTMLVAAANDAIESCWTWADWPELCRIEERTIQGNATTGWYIDYEQSGQTAMGEVFNIYRDNPNTHASPRELQFTLLGDSIRFPDDAEIPTTAWVRYRIRPIDVQARVTAIGMTAALLENIYPAVLSKAVGYLLTAALLEEDGQLDKSTLMESKAETELITERDKFYFQQNQPQTWSARIGHY
jgi:hypothetical protein